MENARPPHSSPSSETNMSLIWPSTFSFSVMPMYSQGIWPSPVFWDTRSCVGYGASLTSCSWRYTRRVSPSMSPPAIWDSMGFMRTPLPLFTRRILTLTLAAFLVNGSRERIMFFSSPDSSSHALNCSAALLKPCWGSWFIISNTERISSTDLPHCCANTCASSSLRLNAFSMPRTPTSADMRSMSRLPGRTV